MVRSSCKNRIEMAVDGQVENEDGEDNLDPRRKTHEIEQSSAVSIFLLNRSATNAELQAEVGIDPLSPRLRAKNDQFHWRIN